MKAFTPFAIKLVSSVLSVRDTVISYSELSHTVLKYNGGHSKSTLALTNGLATTWRLNYQQ